MQMFQKVIIIFIKKCQKNNTLKYNHGEKSMKVPFVIFADTKPLLEKINTCQNNPGKKFTTKVKKHVACGYSLFTHCSFDSKKNKHDFQ